jgi:hypothetical protein
MPLRKLSNLKVDNLPSLHKSRKHNSSSPESPSFSKAIGSLLAPFQQYSSSQQQSPPQRPSFPTNIQPGKTTNPSSSFVSPNRPPCQICGKNSHQALDCYHRMDFAYQGRHPPSQLAAMAAVTQSTTESEQP